MHTLMITTLILPQVIQMAMATTIAILVLDILTTHLGILHPTMIMDGVMRIATAIHGTKH